MAALAGPGTARVAGLAVEHLAPVVAGRAGIHVVSVMIGSRTVPSNVPTIGAPNPVRDARTTVVRPVPVARAVNAGSMGRVVARESPGSAGSMGPVVARGSRGNGGSAVSRGVSAGKGALPVLVGLARVRVPVRAGKGVQAAVRESGGSRDVRRSAGSRIVTTGRGVTSVVLAGAGSRGSAKDVPESATSRPSRDAGLSVRRKADVPTGRRVTAGTGGRGPRSASVPRRGTMIRCSRTTSPARNWTPTPASSCARCRRSWRRRSRATW